MSQEPQTFQNETLNITMTKKPNCVVAVDVDIAPVAVKKAWGDAVKVVNKEVSVPGFRKGKAPQAAIEKDFLKYVDGECRKILLSETFATTMRLVKCYPYINDHIKSDVKSFSRDGGAKVSYEYECEPEIPDIDVSGMDLEVPQPVPVTDADVEGALHEMRVDEAMWKDITGRAVQEGDYVWLDIVTTETPAKKLASDTRFEVSHMGRWMRDLVVGKNVGDTVEGVSERDPHFDPNAEFVATPVKITIKAIKEPELPAIDEAFAKKHGLESVEAFPEYIRGFLTKQAENRAFFQFMERMEAKVLEGCHFEMPLSAIDQEMRFRLYQEVTYLKKEMGLSDEDIKAQQEQIRGKVQARVYRWLCGVFIAKKIARDLKFDVTDDEVYMQYARQLLMMPPYFRDVDEGMPPEVIRQRIHHALLINKAYEHLAGQAGVTRPQRKA